MSSGGALAPTGGQTGTPPPQQPGFNSMADFSMGFGRQFQPPSFLNPFMGGYGFGQPFGGFNQPYGGFGGGFGSSFNQGFGGGFNQPFGGGFGGGIGGLFGGYQQMPYGGYQSMPPMNQGPGNAYAKPFPAPRNDFGFGNMTPPTPSPFVGGPPSGNDDFMTIGGGGTIQYGQPPPGEIPSMDDLGPEMVAWAGGTPGWASGDPSSRRTIAPETPRAPPQQAALLPAVGYSSPYLNMQGLGSLFGGGRGFGISPPSQAQRYDPYSFNPQADAQRQQQQMFMDREANTTDYQRLMQRKNSASAGPYVNPLTGEVGGVNPFSQVQDAEIARSLGWQDPNFGRFMTADYNPERDRLRAEQSNVKAKEYLDSIGYGSEGFDSSKYEVRRQPIGPSPGLSSLFSGFGFSPQMQSQQMQAQQMELMNPTKRVLTPEQERRDMEYTLRSYGKIVDGKVQQMSADSPEDQEWYRRNNINNWNFDPSQGSMG